MPPGARVGTLAGATLLALVLGSLHAFSVLLEPLEAHLQTSRAAVSLAYSIATLCLVAGVFMTSWLLRRVSPSWLAFAACVMCSVGLLFAAHAAALPVLYAGFGVLFGMANGVGYALSIERSGAAFPDRKGVVTGVVTAAYCAGAILFSKVFGVFADEASYQAGLLVLAATISVAGMLVALALRGGPAVAGSAAPASTLPGDARRQVVLLWLVYFLGVASGLMALGHAAAIVSSAGGSTGQLIAGAMLVSVGSATGSILCGWLCDRFEVQQVLTACLLLVCLSMMALIVARNPVLIIGGLTVAGLAYGALITVVPVVVARAHRAEVALSVFGKVFTAWGVAGLAGPWTAGMIFDHQQDYAGAFIFAGTSAAAAVILSRFVVVSKKRFDREAMS